MAEDPTPTRPPWWLRLLRGLGRLALVLGLTVLVALLALTTPPGERWLAGVVQQAVQGLLGEGHTLERPGIALSPTGHVVLTDVAFLDPAGEPILAVRRADLKLRLPDLLAGAVRITAARLDGIEVRLHTDDEGVMNVVRLFGGPYEPEPEDPDAEPYGGLPIDIVVTDLALRDGRFRLSQADAGGVRVDLAVDGVRAASPGVRLPRETPRVEVDDARVDGVLLQPGPLAAQVTAGRVVWTGEGVHVDGGRVRADGSVLTIDGVLDRLFDEGTVDATLGLDPVDLSTVDALFGAGTAGAWAGSIRASGRLSALGLAGRLDGLDGARGGLALAEGSMVCLPVEGPTPSPCLGPLTRGGQVADPEDLPASVRAGPGPHLLWKLVADVDRLHLEDVLPVVGGPLRLDGDLRARGGGTSWPGEVFVADGRWDAVDLDVFGVPLREVGVDIGLHDGSLQLGDVAVTAVAGRLTGDASLDLTTGLLAIDAVGDLDPSMLEDLGVPGVGGEGTLRARLRGDVFAEGAPLDVDGTLDLAPFTYTLDPAAGGGPDVVIDAVSGPLHVHVEDGRTLVDGRLEGRGLATYGVEAATLSVPDLMVVVDEDVVVSGTVVAPVVQYGVGDAGAFADADYLAYVPPEERLPCDPLAGEALACLTEVSGGFRVVVPPDTDPEITVGVDAGFTQVVGLVAERGHLDLSLVGDALHLVPDLRLGDAPFLASPGIDLDLATGRVTTASLVFGPTPRQRWTTEGPVSLRLVDGGVADARLTVRVDAADTTRLRVDGRLATTGPLDGTVAVDGLSLDGLAELFPTLLQDYSGRVDLTLTARGQADRPALDLTLDARELWIPGLLRWLHLSGEASVRDDALTLDVQAAVEPPRGEEGRTVPFAEAVGTVPVRSDLSDLGLAASGPVDLRLVLAPGPLRRVVELVPGLALPEGSLSAVAEVHGDLNDPDLSLAGVSEIVVAGLRQRARAEFGLDRSAGDLGIQLDVYEGLTRVAHVDGLAATRLGEVMDAILRDGEMPDLTDVAVYADEVELLATLDGLPVRMVQELAGTSFDVDGSLGGEVHLTGSLLEPTLEGDLDGGLVLAGTEADLHAVLRPRGAGGYAAELSLGEGGSATWVRVEGTVPVRPDFSTDVGTWGDGAWDLAVGGEGVPLQVLRVVDPGIEALDGRLELAGRVGGSWLAVRPDVRATLAGGRIRYRPIGLEVEDLGLAARLHPIGGTRADPDDPQPLRVTLERLDAGTRPVAGQLRSISQATASRVSATAQVDFVGTDVGQVEGRIRLDDAWLMSTDDRVLRADAKLDVDGLFPALDMRGDITVQQGFLLLNTANLLSTGAAQLDPVVHVHRLTDGTLGDAPVAEDGPAEDGWFEQLTARVDLDLGRSMSTRLLVPVFEDLGGFGANLTRADIDARLGGVLDVSLRGGQPSIVGDVEVIDGSLRILGSKFALEPGSAITFYGQDYANPRMDFAGNMSVTGGDLTVLFQGTPSDPELELRSDAFASDAELFTILLTGEAPADLTSAQGGAAVQAVGDLLLNSVLGGVNLGSVSVEADGTVRVGVPLYRTVFLETLFRPNPGLNENQVVARLEWNVIKRLVLDAAYGDRRVWGNIFWERRF